MTRPNRPSPLAILAGLLALYLLVPLVALAGRLIGNGAGGLNGASWAALVVSAETSTITAAILLALAVPFGYVLAHTNRRWVKAGGVLAQLPLAMPPLVSGIVLILAFGPHTWLGRLTGGRLTDTMAGIILAQTFVAAPFVVIASRSAFASLDPALDEVVATLGHRALARFRLVALPLAWPGIRAGLGLAWLRAFGEFGATVVVAYHPYSLPVLTFVNFSGTGLRSALGPVVLALGGALAFLVLTAPSNRSRRFPPARQAHGPLSGLDPSPADQDPGSARGFDPGPDAFANLSFPAGSSDRLLGFDLSRDLGEFSLQASFSASASRLAILGPSGSGKTLSLRLLAGLDKDPAHRNRVTLGHRELGQLAPEERLIGYVPQNQGLLPHLGVSEQVRLGSTHDTAPAQWWSDRLGLSELGDRFPGQLSGGQRQRVALARALARQPDLLLLDEPLSALDAPARASLRRILRQVQSTTGLTSVVVTHDPDEAAALADEVIVLAHGQVLQAGRVESVLAHPRSAEVAGVLGIANIATAVATDDRTLSLGAHKIAVAGLGPMPGQAVGWCIPAEGIRITRSGGLEARVTDVIDMGHAVELEVRLDSGPTLVLRGMPDDPGLAGIRPDQECRVVLDPDLVSWWNLA